MVNFLIYLFIAIAHKGKKKKINPMSLLVLIKHILILCAYAYATRCSNLALPQIMGADTVYEHFNRDKFTGRKSLWVRFIGKEQKWNTTSNKDTSFYGLRSTHSRPGQFSQMVDQSLEETSRIIVSFYLLLNTVISIKFRCFPLIPIALYCLL